MMHKVTVTRKMTNDALSIWNVLDDFGNIFKYHPGVESSNILDKKKTGLGAKRICNFYDGTGLKETIIKYVPNRNYSVELSDFSFPLKKATAHFQIESLNENGSILSVTMEFIPKFGPLGWLMGKLMMRPMLKKVLNGMAKGLDEHISTGQIVGKDGELLKPVQATN